MATHARTLALRILWLEQPMGSQRVGHDSETNAEASGASNKYIEASDVPRPVF